MIASLPTRCAVRFWGTISVGIPFASDALFWLDGTILSDEFVDRSGNGRNFTITNNDITISGFPYKSIATVSAPVGDSVLFAADVNGYYYGVDEDNPNEIPVNAFFQNQDYENINYSRHVPQLVDGNGVEISQPYVTDIVLYAAALTGADITVAETYFHVPTVDATAYWVDPNNGNDGNNGTTKALAWATVQHAEDQAGINNNRVYIMTGEEDLTSLWVDDFIVDWFSLGYFIINDNEQARVLRCNTASTYTGIYFKETGANDDCVLNYGDGATFNRCKFSGGTSSWRVSVFNNTNLNYCITGRYRIMAADVTVNIDTCINVFTGFQDSAGSIISTINSYCGIEERIYQNIVSITAKGNTYVGAACVSQINNNLTGIVSLTYCNYIADQASAGLIWPVVLINMTFTYTATDNTIDDGGFDSILISSGALVNATLERNVYLNDGGGDVALGISGDYDGIASVLSIKNNTIIKRSGIGAIIALGNDEVAGSIGDLDGSILEGQVLYGPDYFGDTGTGSHSILILNQQDIKVRYNRLFENQIGIVIKNEHGSAQSFADGVVMNNVLTNTFLMSRGMGYVKFYGNTVINSYVHLLETVGTLTQAQNCQVKNNIIINNTPIIVDDDSEVGFASDYNIFYAPGGTLSFSYKGASKTLTEWRALGYDANSIELTEEQYNNLFTDPDNGDYILKVGSIARLFCAPLAAAYDDGLDDTTDWGDGTEPSTYVTKQQTGLKWDCGAFVSSESSIESLKTIAGLDLKTKSAEDLKRKN